MTLRQYLDTLRDQAVTVLGLGVSNLPLTFLLAGGGARVTARDRRSRDQLGAATAEALERMGVELILGDDYLRGLPAGLIFCTPGINPRRQEIADAVARGATVDSEMNLFMRLCPCPVIGVTGSDGKTTTTTLIYEMLKAAGKSVWLGGNIGTPLLERVDEIQPTDLVVVELSSFQLMTVRHPPNIGVITNISPNHLDVHTDMDEYVEAKCAIFQGQSRFDLCVFNADNEMCLDKSDMAPGEVRLFSRLSRPLSGVWLAGDTIWCDGQAVMRREDIGIPGIHNVENYMAAIAALYGLVPFDVMRQVARDFKGVEHRLELVGELGGVRYYNDSIGSSPSRTVAGLKCFEGPLTLIAGGYDKQIPFDALGEEIVQRVRLLLLCGATAEKIEQAVKAAPGYEENRPEIRRFDTLDETVAAARQLAEPGEIVLFSPACASFDQFKDFGERGRYFKKLVEALRG